MKTDTPYRNGAMLLWLSAVLAGIGPFFGSPTSFVAIALVLAILAMVLMRGKRWMAYLAFLATGFLGSIVLAWIWPMNGALALWAIVTTAACWLTAAILLAALWHAKREANPQL